MQARIISGAAWKSLPRPTRARLERLFAPGALRSAVRALEDRLRRWNGGSLGAPRLVEIETQRWRRFLLELAANTRRFCGALDLDFSRPLVRSLVFDLSDPHSGGRAVVRAELNSGEVWFYKPRSGKHEQAWSMLLQRLGEARFSPAFYSPRIVSRKTHYWVQEVRPSPCQNRAEVERFYFRAGAILYLAHLFRAVDLHAGNIIAWGEHPVLIDCETFFHPAVPLPPRTPDRHCSLLRTGMLPIRPGSGKADDVSFLGGGAGAHAVYLGRQRISVTSMSALLVAGFQEMHAFLGRAWERRAIRQAVAAMRSLPVRCIYRPTRLYARLLEESLAFAANREAQRCFLQSELADGIHRLELIESETAQLLELDIPLFRQPATAPRPRPTRKQFAALWETLRRQCG